MNEKTSPVAGQLYRHKPETGYSSFEPNTLKAHCSKPGDIILVLHYAERAERTPRVKFLDGKTGLVLEAVFPYDAWDIWWEHVNQENQNER